jgi:hypothetical protein
VIAFAAMSQYRVTVIRTTRYVVEADSVELAELRVREDLASLDVIDSAIEVLVDPLSLTPIPVPEVDHVGDEDPAPSDATGADRKTD